MPDTLKIVFAKLKEKKWTMATAESCTGGLISAAITAVPGSSDFFDRGFVTYSNKAKMQQLDVTKDTLAKYGAVSEATAREMVYGVLNHSEANLALSVTGIAGPGGGTKDKPVGLVYIGYGLRGTDDIKVAQHNFIGDRRSIREKAAAAALHHALSLLE